MTQVLDKTAIKFVLVGMINTLVGTGVMFLLYNVVHVNYWISSAANYIVGSIVSYVLNKYFTFQNKEKSWKQLVKFIVNISICYLLAYGIAKPLVSYILSSFSTIIKENIAMLVGMGFFVIFNYIGQRFVVFKHEN
ncbi:MAG: GtrA family protein [Ruminococcaceae bacterium]|nr:GtrA family protein [Oscillospiraceae bacterium]